MKTLLPLLLLLTFAAHAANRVTDDTFDNDVLKSKGLLVVIFGRLNCMTCEAFEGEIPACEAAIKQKFLCLDTVKNPKSFASAMHVIKSSPMLVLYKAGKIVGSCRGGNHNDVIRRLKKLVRHSESMKDDDAPLLVEDY